jgi:uncharacterized protein YkwD
VRPSKDLDKVAREWSRGGRLREALARTGYRAVNSASMHIEGASDDDKIIQTLANKYCETITDPQFTELGVFRQGREIAIVVATPFSAPGIREATAIGNRVLALVNDARSKQQRCGSNSFPAVTPLALSATLTQAALKHAQDMASHNRFEHTGSDGSTPSQRISQAGYKWRAVAENIAAGPTTPEEVVNGWLKSPGHCVNIMSPAYTQMGIAYAVDEKSEAGIYWSQEFATPG